MTAKPYTTCIVGLGLMGGSLALALRGFRGGRVVAFARSASTCERALDDGIVDFATPDMALAVAEADLTIYCTPPDIIPRLLAQGLPHMKHGAVACDICGVKTGLLAALAPLLADGPQYISAHPMAGKEVGGLANADKNLFVNTGFLITPLPTTNPDTLALAHELAAYIGATKIAVVPPALHDDIIAYSSDLMHIAASALCMDMHPDLTPAFTAGAFRDCTRVGNIDAALWTELLMDNRAAIAGHLARYRTRLEQMQQALEAQNAPALQALLQLAGDNKRSFLQP